MPGIDDSVPGATENGLVLQRKKTAVGAALAALCNAWAGVITTEALATAAGASINYTITNNKVRSDSCVMVNVGYGTATTGTPTEAQVNVSNGSFTVTVQNIHASAALNGTLKIFFVIH